MLHGWKEIRHGTVFTRRIVLIDDGMYAVVTLQTPRTIVKAAFALPPDSEPTGRLWARLEKQLGG